MRFNSRYGDTFVVPEADDPARPAPGSWTCRTRPSKMSKSADSAAGHDPAARRPGGDRASKFKRAVTDTDSEVRYDPDDQARRVATCSRSSAAATGRDARGGRRGLHPVRPAEGRHRRGRGRAAGPDPGALRRAGRRPRPRCTASSTTGRSGPARPRRRPSPGPAPRSGCSRPDDEPAPDRALDAGLRPHLAPPGGGRRGARRVRGPRVRRPRRPPCSCPRRPTRRRPRRWTPAARAPSAPPSTRPPSPTGSTGPSAQATASEPGIGVADRHLLVVGDRRHRRRRGAHRGHASSAAPARSTT